MVQHEVELWPGYYQCKLCRMSAATMHHLDQVSCKGRPVLILPPGERGTQPPERRATPQHGR